MLLEREQSPCQWFQEFCSGQYLFPVTILIWREGWLGEMHWREFRCLLGRHAQ